MILVIPFLLAFFIASTNQLIAQNHAHTSSLELTTLIHNVLEQNSNLTAAQSRIQAASIAIPRVHKKKHGSKHPYGSSLQTV